MHAFKLVSWNILDTATFFRTTEGKHTQDFYI